MQSIELTIRRWKTINFLTKNKAHGLITTIDVPEDSTICWNNIAKKKKKSKKKLTTRKLWKKY